ncbi:hypothetical protein LEP1GSC188_4358 [Leptospira weilii serovar Topaz str. LT2116]|uniref:Uncharacterized protein n=1 Tax=Leptospira weilii serovar Topaz str. LT2116 TaxID=1088540 RepID=M3H4H3_9LEPT|nr:hypothetical protein LEP1GSC188_4358 [Leptospira weilii serovar Topaz str. LT2116]
MSISFETNAEKKNTPERQKRRKTQASRLGSTSKIPCFHPDQIHKIPYFRDRPKLRLNLKRKPIFMNLILLKN